MFIYVCFVVWAMEYIGYFREGRVLARDNVKR
jgi:hypothetical protein